VAAQVANEGGLNLLRQLRFGYFRFIIKGALEITNLAKLSLLALCAGCSSHAAAKPQPSPTPASVAMVTTTAGVINPTLQLAGVITPYRQVGIAADLSEPISEVDVEEGQQVHAGQVVARLVTDDLEAQLASAQRVVLEDVARYRQTAFQLGAVNGQDASAIQSARAALRQAQVNLSGATRDLRRYEALEVQGYIARETVDQQRTTVSSDTEAVNAAQGALAQALANARANGTGVNAGEQQQELQAARAAADAAQASVEQLRRQIGRAVLVTPIDGIVDAVNANPGEYPTERELFTIEQISQVYAILSTSTAQVAQIRPGAAASLAAAGSTRKDRGTVVAILDELQPGTTNFSVKVLIANADGHLRAGMPVSGSVDLPPVHGIEIPMTAFVDDTYSTVYTVSNGVARTTKVVEVKSDGSNAIVTGLATGTMIIKDVDAANVGNGDRVEPSAASK
jgi:multidrug efflux pump subunit AcrA (membrane-fusion protein)